MKEDSSIQHNDCVTTSGPGNNNLQNQFRAKFLSLYKEDTTTSLIGKTPYKFKFYQIVSRFVCVPPQTCRNPAWSRGEESQTQTGEAGIYAEGLAVEDGGTEAGRSSVWLVGAGATTNSRYWSS